jgi:hypothetical protein
VRGRSSLAMPSFCALGALACAACGEPVQTLAVQTARWDTLWTYQATLEDTALIAPTGLESFRGGVVVRDGNEPRITAFSADGEIRWIYAPLKGDGPGEMRAVRDAVESEEGLWIVGSPPRLILLSDDGEVLRQLSISPVPGGLVTAIELVGPDAALIATSGRIARVSLLDGRIENGPNAIPWTRQPPENWFWQTSLATGDGIAAVGMTYGPEVLLLGNDSVTVSIFREEVTYRPGQRLEGGGMMPGGAPSGQIPFGAWQLRLVERDIWMLTGGAWLNDRWGKEEPRLNDQLLAFSREGVLIGRRTLPFDTQDFDVDRDVVYLLSRTGASPCSVPCIDDSPKVVALRRRPIDLGGS